MPPFNAMVGKGGPGIFTDFFNPPDIDYTKYNLLTASSPIKWNASTYAVTLASSGATGQLLAVAQDRQTNRLYVEANIWSTTSGYGPGYGYIANLNNYIGIQIGQGLVCVNAGVATTLAGNIGSYTQSDVMRLEIDGASRTYVVKKNGVVVTSGALPSGFPVNSRRTGFMAFTSAGAQANYLDSFRTGDL